MIRYYKVFYAAQRKILRLSVDMAALMHNNLQVRSPLSLGIPVSDSNTGVRFSSNIDTRNAEFTELKDRID
ncbi:hypothetical protein [Parasitella parasitica]|uniref:Uncharacterized protein n=1 Tax=Parasitella parasitica TaxID=35722 RepID=A0A0B7NW66_9FUNG|nr:hypothetical protein [Parasitella parasitica]